MRQKLRTAWSLELPLQNSSSRLGLHSLRRVPELSHRFGPAPVAVALHIWAVMGLRVALLVLFATACVAGDSDPVGPSEDELGDLEEWATVTDSKADLPGTFSDVVAWLRDVYTNRMSAI